MPRVSIQLRSPVRDSFRVRQAAGMFDLPLEPFVSEQFSADVPGVDEDWQIGLIVGPSGSGKSAIARTAFPEAILPNPAWPEDRALVDCFGDAGIRAITRTLCAVGFSSPRNWIKPYAVLSDGEKFRADLARTLLKDPQSLCRVGVPPTDHFSPAEQMVGDTPTLQKSHRVSASSPSPGNPGEGWGEGSAEKIPVFGSPSRQTLTLPSPGIPGEGKDLASTHPPLVLVDEFTSAVDRVVARFGSAALSRAIRSGGIARRLVAITCHRDVIPWLAPDWVLDMQSQRLTRMRLSPPEVRLVIKPADRAMWNLFKKHHYLSGSLHNASRCFAGYVEGKPAVFTAVLPFPHATRPGWREHRTVCLPQYQGIGIGATMAAYIASLYVATGRPYFSSTGHPAVIAHRMQSPLWQMRRRPGLSRPISPSGMTGMAAAQSVSRITAGFEYIGLPRFREAMAMGVITRE